MILLTFHEWVGPSRDFHGENPPRVSEQQIALATNLGLGDALKRVFDYQCAFNLRYHLTSALNLSLLGITHVDIDNVDMRHFQALGVQFVDDLPIVASEVGEPE